jgi:hemolysin III
MSRVTLGKMQNPVRGFLHGSAAIASLVGLAVLAAIGDVGVGVRIALVVYGASLVALFTTSSLYHSVPWSDRWKDRLRRLDHSAIFLVVAGSFTPFAVVALQGAWRTASLVVLWMAAATGIIVKVSERRIRLGPSVTIQSAMGWAGVLPMFQIGKTLGADTVVWIGVGGLLYTVGMVFMLTKWPRIVPRVFSYHELFHVMVVAAALIHFLVIVTKVVPAA